jgi:hypothetical protein
LDFRIGHSEYRLDRHCWIHPSKPLAATCASVRRMPEYLTRASLLQCVDFRHWVFQLGFFQSSTAEASRSCTRRSATSHSPAIAARSLNLRQSKTHGTSFNEYCSCHSMAIPQDPCNPAQARLNREPRLGVPPTHTKGLAPRERVWIHLPACMGRAAVSSEPRLKSISFYLCGRWNRVGTPVQKPPVFEAH